MMFIFDTSSFVSLARYYLPFDHQEKIYNHVKQGLENRRILLIDAVLEECRFVAKRIVIEKLDFLLDKSFLKANHLPLKTEDIIPASPRKFYNMVDNNFTTPARIVLTDTEFESNKREFLRSADTRMVMYAFNRQHQDPDVDIVIVTEESEQANDNKAFKKLPAICHFLDLRTMPLPEYLALCEDLNMKLG